MSHSVVAGRTLRAIGQKHYKVEQLRDGEWLGEMDGMVRDRHRASRPNLVACTHQHDWQRRVQLACVIEQRPPVEMRHHDVGDDQIRRGDVDDLQGH